VEIEIDMNQIEDAIIVPQDTTSMSSNGVAPSANVQNLDPRILADLARSGLSNEDAEKLGIEDLTRERRPAYKIPYFDIDGKLTDFYRKRFLDDGEQRYTQPAKMAPRLYLPPYFDWKGLAGARPDGKKVPFIFTEGEKKASRASKAGFPVIALGGVWNFLSEKVLISDFKLFEWKDRQITIIYDSDVTAKPSVRAALHAFAREMSALGADPRTVMLPNGPEGSKTGLDDFIEREGAEALLELLSTSEPFDEIAEFWKLNEEYAVIVKPPTIYQLKDRQLLKHFDFTKIVAATNRVKWIDKAGKESIVSAAEKWLQWPARRQYTRLAYEPGQPLELPNGGYNQYDGPTDEVENAPLIKEFWTGLLERLFPATDDVSAEEAAKARKWIEQWACYPIKFPGAKLHQGVLLWGPQGAGKSLLGKVIARQYGGQDGALNWAEVSQAQLVGNFNQYLGHKQFIIYDEVFTTDKRSQAPKIKAMITREWLPINIKYQPEYVLRDCVQHFLTSNEPNCAYLDNDDRRLFIWHLEKVLDEDQTDPNRFGRRVDVISQTPEFQAALRWHARHVVDFTGYEPQGRAMLTTAKVEMAVDGAGDLDRFIRSRIEDADALESEAGKPTGADLCTLSGIADLIQTETGRRPSESAIINAIKRLGGKQLTNGLAGKDRKPLQVKVDKDHKPRPWALRNAAYWQGSASTPAKIVEAIKGSAFFKGSKF
jgi:hypothetical protein